jgi:predicted nucleic acid-binding Zn ribbon protein
VRRLAPRPLRAALEDVTRTAAPAGLLAQVQSSWGEVAGPTIAAEAEPVSEREGVVTVRCSSAVWAHELELLRGDLMGRLNAAVSPSGAVRGLRFVASGRPR